MSGPEIAEVLSMPRSTVSAILARIGLGKLSALERPEPPNRYERRRPGGLLHINVKKLAGIDRAGHRVTGSRRGQAAGVGWEYVYVCIDDATRLAYVEVLTDERAITAVGFLRRAVAHFASYGIRVERVMTDNASAYRSAVHALASQVPDPKRSTSADEALGFAVSVSKVCPSPQHQRRGRPQSEH